CNPPCALRGRRRAFTDQPIVIVERIVLLIVVPGGVLSLLALNPCEMGPHFLRREQAANTGNKTRQLLREYRAAGRSINEIQQFLGDQVIERRFHPVTQLDLVGSVTLLYPNLVKFSRIHRMVLPLMTLPSIGSAPAAW